jgi:hypothetical protein
MRHQFLHRSIRVQERAVCPLLRVLFPVWSLSGGNKQIAAQFLLVFVIIREFDLLVLVSSSSFGPLLWVSICCLVTESVASPSEFLSI